MVVVTTELSRERPLCRRTVTTQLSTAAELDFVLCPIDIDIGSLHTYSCERIDAGRSSGNRLAADLRSKSLLTEPITNGFYFYSFFRFAVVSSGWKKWVASRGKCGKLLFTFGLANYTSQSLNSISEARGSDSFEPFFPLADDSSDSFQI